MKRYRQENKYEHTIGGIDGYAGFFRNEAGEKQQYMLMTHDLVCFQTTTLPQEAYLWHELPFLKTVDRENGITNIAIEFDPAWKAPTEGEFDNTPRGNRQLTSLVVAKTALQHVWFIDYRLRRRTNITQTQKDQSYLIRQRDLGEENARVEDYLEGEDDAESYDDFESYNDFESYDDFEIYDDFENYEDFEINDDIESNADNWAERQIFQGNKCRFIEVRPFDADWELSDGSLMFPRHLDTLATLDPNPILTFDHTSPFDFVNDMEKNSWGPVYNYAHSTMADWSPGPPTWDDTLYCGHHGRGAKLHVLAYEECD